MRASVRLLAGLVLGTILLSGCAEISSTKDDALAAKEACAKVLGVGAEIAQMMGGAHDQALVGAEKMLDLTDALAAQDFKTVEAIVMEAANNASGTLDTSKARVLLASYKEHSTACKDGASSTVS